MIWVDFFQLSRLIQYDVKTKHAKVLLTNLYFANGVQLSSSENELLVCDTFEAKIIK